MLGKKHRLRFAGLAAGLLVTAFLLPAPLPAQSKKASAANVPPSESGDRIPTEPTLKPWTGDLDGMMKRRQIRILVPYSKTHYFVDRGTQYGLAYDTFRLFEDDLNKHVQSGHVRVHVVFLPVSRDQFLPALLEGRGDIAAAGLTITPERRAKVDFADPTTKNVSEIVVTGPGRPPIATADDLSGQEVYVRKSSTFYESLTTLNANLARAGKPPVRIRLAPESLETEDLLEMVNAGLVGATISDDHIAEFWSKVYPNIVLHKGAAIRTGGEIAWMIRKDSPKLKAALDKFLAKYPAGSSTRNQLLQKYLKNTKFARGSRTPEEIAKFQKVIELFRKYGSQYDVDYLLVAAQGYQESRLDQAVKSPVGAIGVMQVMPPTGKDMGVGDITELEPNIHAGVKYVRFMIEKYYGDQPMDSLNKALFTFASYNAGPGRIAQMRKLATQRGLNPNVWFNNVEVVVADKIGRETVTYVSNIYKYYLAYQMVTEEIAERDRSRKALEAEKPKP